MAQTKWDTVVITGKCITNTAKATLMEIEGEKKWIPNSQFKEPSIRSTTQEDWWTMFIPRWLAETNRIEYMEYEEWEDLQEEE